MFETKECLMHSWYESRREYYKYDYKEVTLIWYECSNCGEELERFHEEYVKEWYL